MSSLVSLRKARLAGDTLLETYPTKVSDLVEV